MKKIRTKEESIEYIDKLEIECYNLQRDISILSAELFDIYEWFQQGRRYTKDSYKRQNELEKDIK